MSKSNPFTVLMLAGLVGLGVAGCTGEEAKPPAEKSTLHLAQSEDLSKRALEILNQKCTVCHGAERFEARHFTPEEWETVINRMVSKGVELSGDEMDILRHFREPK